MKNHLPTVTIFITAASWAGFAIWLGVNPNALLGAFGIEDRTPQMATEIRAFYGGLEMAIAVAMIVLWRRGDTFASLLIGGLPLLGSASGRLVGSVVDGFSMMHLGFAGLELLGAAFCFVGAQMVSRGERGD
ncbi:DUF4345 family protein [Rubripirellula amarantea]|nr:DUF4345 family protein [Rubripirellula amarantea]